MHRNMDDLPKLDAFETFVDGSRYWLVWCEHCRAWHRHGPAEGHRVAHCLDAASPYWTSGYILKYADRFELRN